MRRFEMCFVFFFCRCQYLFVVFLFVYLLLFLLFNRGFCCHDSDLLLLAVTLWFSLLQFLDEQSRLLLNKEFLAMFNFHLSCHRYSAKPKTSPAAKFEDRFQAYGGRVSTLYRHVRQHQDHPSSIPSSSLSRPSPSPPASSSSSSSSSSLLQSKLDFSTFPRQRRDPNNLAVVATKYCCASLLPIYHVNSDAFRWMLQQASLSQLGDITTSTFPDRHTCTNILFDLTSEYRKLSVAKYAKAFDTSKCFYPTASLCIDGWTSRVTEHYVGTSIHYITDYDGESGGFECVSEQLDVMFSDEPHTGENIKEELLRLRSRWGIQDQLFCGVSDGEAAMKKAMRLTIADDAKPLMCNHVCMDHRLQRCITRLYEDEVVAATWQRAKKTIALFHRSTSKAAKLRQAQVDDRYPHTLVLLRDNETRWMSKYYAARRILRLKNVLANVLLDITGLPEAEQLLSMLLTVRYLIFGSLLDLLYCISK